MKTLHSKMLLQVITLIIPTGKASQNY